MGRDVDMPPHMSLDACQSRAAQSLPVIFLPMFPNAVMNRLHRTLHGLLFPPTALGTFSTASVNGEPADEVRKGGDVIPAWRPGGRVEGTRGRTRMRLIKTAAYGPEEKNRWDEYSRENDDVVDIQSLHIITERVRHVTDEAVGRGLATHESDSWD